MQARGGGGQMGGGGINELVRQAARMQRRIDEAKAKIKDTEVSASTAGDKVTATVTCEGKIKRLDIDAAFLASEGLEMSLDALGAAINSAMEKADKLVDEAVGKVTGGVKLPGM